MKQLHLLRHHQRPELWREALGEIGVVEHRRPMGAARRIVLVAMKPNGRLAYALDDREDRLALLLADGVAEDPADEWLPSTGTVHRFDVPGTPAHTSGLAFRVQFPARVSIGTPRFPSPCSMCPTPR
jgi:catechol 2,3-dioxygenase-like lactoylglutathione lyase family enzyme